MPKVDLDAVPAKGTTGYPPPFDREMDGRWQQRIGDAAGLTHLGANFVTLKPGAWSSQRHWHHGEDELVVMLSGEAVLVEDQDRTALHPGDICAWPMGSTNGHHLINESGVDCSFVAISAGPDLGGEYSDIDMTFTDEGYYHKDGSRYPAERMK